MSKLFCRNCNRDLDYTSSLFLEGWAWCYPCFKVKFPDRVDLMRNFLMYKLKNGVNTVSQ